VRFVSSAARNRHALIRQLANEAPHVADPCRVETVRRLVQKEKPRITKKRRRDAESLAHSLGVGRDPVVATVGEAELLQHRLHAPRVGPVAVERGEQAQVPASCQIRIESRLLDEAPDTPERGRPESRIGSEDGDRPRVASHEAEQDAHRRRLARPVGAEKPVDLARGNGEIDVVHGAPRSVVLDEASDLDCRFHAFQAMPKGGPQLLCAD
jgi:hypothetical protein